MRNPTALRTESNVKGPHVVSALAKLPPSEADGLAPGKSSSRVTQELHNLWNWLHTGLGGYAAMGSLTRILF
jgi:hypothetical protein